MTRSGMDQQGDPSHKDLELDDKLDDLPITLSENRKKRKQVCVNEGDLQRASVVTENSSKKRYVKGKDSCVSLQEDSAEDQENVDVIELPVNTPVDYCNKQLFVWPWMGIVVYTLPKKVRTRSCVEESKTRVTGELDRKGFSFVRVQALCGYQNTSQITVVEFSKDWFGFCNALLFERAYDADHHGRKDWYSSKKRKTGTYAWVACADDFNSKCIIGDKLREIGNLKTIAEIADSEAQKREELASLERKVQLKNMQLQEMEEKSNQTSNSLRSLIAEKEKLEQSYTEEMKKVQGAYDCLRSILIVHGNSTLQQVGSQRSDCQEVRKRSRQEDIHLEGQVDENRALKQEIEQLRGKIEVMKHEEAELLKRMGAVLGDFKEKEETLQDMEDLNLVLIKKERQSNVELQEARKQLIDAFRGPVGSHIGIKMMGELDPRPFLEASMQKNDGLAAEGGSKLCSLWGQFLADPSWYPFKIIAAQGKCQEVIDDEDEKLKGLKYEMGDDVYKAVSTALLEMNEYNFCGRHVVPKLWNYREGREATLKEGIKCIVEAVADR